MTTRLLGWGSCAFGALGVLRSVPPLLRPLNLPLRELETTDARLKGAASRQDDQQQQSSVPSLVAAGHGHSLFSQQLGLQTAIIGMGLNTDGQLGADRDKHEMVVPQRTVHQLSPTQQIKALSCGRAHSAILATSHASETLFMAGDNIYGQLGIPPTRQPVRAMHEVHVGLPEGTRIKDVVCGLDHTLLLTDQGDVLTTGWNADGQLGQGTAASRGEFTRVQDLPFIVKVSTKADMNLALARDGTVFAWGNNEYAQHMISAKETRILSPVQLPIQETVFDVAAGGSFILLMLGNGRVLSCGYGLGLGQGSGVVEAPAPAPVHGLPKDGVAEVYASISFAAAVTADRRIFTWGAGRHGQLGLGVAEDGYIAREVLLPEGFGIVHTALGTDHVLLSGIINL